MGTEIQAECPDLGMALPKRGSTKVPCKLPEAPTGSVLDPRGPDPGLREG